MGLYIGNNKYKVMIGNQKCSFVIDKKVLPYDYEVEYLESTGTQWIDTGINGFMNHTYKIEFQQTDTKEYRIWGVLGQSSYQGLNMSLTYRIGGGWIIRWESSTNGENLIDLRAIDTNKHILIINNGLVNFDGVYKGQSVGHNTNTVINYNLYLFTINPANNTPSANSHMKIYSYKDTDMNGNIIRDFIPVRVGQVGCMYDKVSGQLFYNQGTGRFILGPDK